MVKGFGRRWASVDTLFRFPTQFPSTEDKRMTKTKKEKKDKAVVAYRKSCKAKGTGLSHYILMDKKAK